MIWNKLYQFPSGERENTSRAKRNKTRLKCGIICRWLIRGFAREAGANEKGVKKKRKRGKRTKWSERTRSVVNRNLLFSLGRVQLRDTRDSCTKSVEFASRRFARGSPNEKGFDAFAKRREFSGGWVREFSAIDVLFRANQLHKPSWRGLFAWITKRDHELRDQSLFVSTWSGRKKDWYRSIICALRYGLINFYCTN